MQSTTEILLLKGVPPWQRNWRKYFWSGFSFSEPLRCRSVVTIPLPHPCVLHPTSLTAGKAKEVPVLASRSRVTMVAWAQL